MKVKQSVVMIRRTYDAVFDEKLSEGCTLSFSR